MSRKVLVLVALAALAGIAGLASALLRDTDAEEGDGARADPVATAPFLEGGPLELPSDSMHAIFPVELGRPYTWGEVMLRNAGRLPVTIDDVEFVNAPPGLTFVAVRAVHPDDGLVGFLPGLRLEGVPPVGLLLQPGREDDVELLVGVRIDRPGSYGIDGVRVRLHDALGRYVVDFDQRLTVCGPAARYTTMARCRDG